MALHQNPSPCYNPTSFFFNLYFFNDIIVIFTSIYFQRCRRRRIHTGLQYSFFVLFYKVYIGKVDANECWVVGGCQIDEIAVNRFFFTFSLLMVIILFMKMFIVRLLLITFLFFYLNYTMRNVSTFVHINNMCYHCTCYEFAD